MRTRRALLSMILTAGLGCSALLGCGREREITIMGEMWVTGDVTKGMIPPWMLPNLPKSICPAPGAHGGGPSTPDDDDLGDDASKFPPHGIVPERGHEDRL